MPNQSGQAYALTTLCPIASGGENNRSFASLVQARLQSLPSDENSPFALVPNTYLCRLFVLENVRYQGLPAQQDQLQSKYLVYTSNFHGGLDTYLAALWARAQTAIRQIFEHCVSFEMVRDAAGFQAFIRACQVETTFFFNGSNDKPLDRQLKGLYLKQELSKFAAEHQGLAPDQLQQAFKAFVRRTEPRNLAGPSWRPGAATLKAATARTDSCNAPGMPPCSQPWGTKE